MTEKKLPYDRKRSPEDYNYDITRHINNSAPVMEAYRLLRTNIEFSKSINEIKRILITSSIMGEGKSTTAINLARIFALGGSKTLIIDLDLRRPVVHKILGIENKNGIMDCFLGKTDEKDIIKETIFENLYAINCGEHPINPAEILASDKLKNMIDVASKDFDVVIIDSPPSAGLADASIVSRFTDATLLIVSAGYASYADVENAIENLNKAGANILGIVMNNITKRSRGYKYYYYDY